MRNRFLLPPAGLIFLSVGLSWSCKGPVQPAPTAAITVRAPATIAARACAHWVQPTTELEAVAEIFIDETAGVGGEIIEVVILLAGSGGLIEGPGTLDPTSLMRFGASTLRINARGTLRLPAIGLHFSPTHRDRLPGVLQFTVRFRDDNGHTVASREMTVQVTPQ